MRATTVDSALILLKVPTRINKWHLHLSKWKWGAKCQRLTHLSKVTIRRLLLPPVDIFHLADWQEVHIADTVVVPSPTSFVVSINLHNYMHTHTHVHTHVHTHTCTYTSTHVHTCTHAHNTPTHVQNIAGWGQSPGNCVSSIGFVTVWGSLRASLSFFLQFCVVFLTWVGSQLMWWGGVSPNTSNEPVTFAHWDFAWSDFACAFSKYGLDAGCNNCD